MSASIIIHSPSEALIHAWVHGYHGEKELLKGIYGNMFIFTWSHYDGD